MYYLVIYLQLSKNIFNGKLTKLTKEKGHDYITKVLGYFELKYSQMIIHIRRTVEKSQGCYSEGIRKKL